MMFVGLKLGNTMIETILLPIVLVKLVFSILFYLSISIYFIWVKLFSMVMASYFASQRHNSIPAFASWNQALNKSQFTVMRYI